MRARWAVLAGFAIAALLAVAAVALIEPFGPPAETEDVVLDCDAVLTGGRHPDIPRVALEPLLECRPEATVTLALIRDDGPFFYPQDDETFFNREGYLPRADAGAYREYTVDTTGLDHRGMRRVVTFGEAEREPGDYSITYYTDDHYDTFWRVVEE